MREITTLWVGQHLAGAPAADVGDDQALLTVNLGLVQAEPLGQLGQATEPELPLVELPK